MNDQVFHHDSGNGTISQIANSSNGTNTSAKSDTPIHPPVSDAAKIALPTPSNNGVDKLDGNTLATPSTNALITEQESMNTVQTSATTNTSTHEKHANNSVHISPMYSEDMRMNRFLHLLSTSTTTAASNVIHESNDKSQNSIRSAPTVPIALTRRILHRQGVGYANDTTPSIVSGAADRFIATVLQHSLTCRDRRLKGEKLAKSEWKELRKTRKRMRVEQKQHKIKRKLIEEGLERLSKVTGDNSSSGSGKNKKSKTSSKENPTNGKKSMKDEAHQELKNMEVEKALLSDSDSVDEEKQYYEQHHSETNLSNVDDTINEDDGEESYDEGESDEDEEDEDDDEGVLLLRDIIRPLSAWGMSITGKVGFGATNPLMSQIPKTSTAKKSIADENRSDLDDVGASDQENMDLPDGDEDDGDDSKKVLSPKGNSAKKLASTTKKSASNQKKN